MSSRGGEIETELVVRACKAGLRLPAGSHVKAVQGILGHSPGAMTLDIYVDLFDDDLDAVADALDAVVSRLDVAKMLPRTAVGE
ncbi:integrase [Arthrobacter sp. ISL-28]|uniref:integrase n=1 Tax=Arthrobacter sp. ISL-28 TaxID=2819108 RepID=UPI001BEA7B9B|nr:integrase [Arthrobacter sp. ISL-28]MBT2523744.1 integrase [Arthrobacter sp. ISL-28]